MYFKIKCDKFVPGGQSQVQKVMTIYFAVAHFFMHSLDSFFNFLSNDTNFMKIGQPVPVQWSIENWWPRSFLLKQQKKGRP